MKKIKTKIKNSGFVILFAVTLSAILLSVALGVANIAVKEIKFGTSTKDTNDAFFAADTGAECALFNDKTTSTIFVPSPSAMPCLGRVVAVSENPASVWSFSLFGLGPEGKGCANVTVDKTTTPTKITSLGYNNSGALGCSPGLNTVERQVELNY
jgi:hypothetical protein